MQRTNIIQLKPSKNQKKILEECMLLSSCVYNITNYKVRQQFFRKEKVSSFFDLQQKIQGMDELLGRVYALPRIQIYSETNTARFKLIKSKTQDEVGLPKYLKNRKTNTTIPSYLVIDNCQYSIKKKYVILPLSRQMRKKYGIKHFHIKYNGVLKWNGKQQRGQVKVKDGKLYLHQSVEVLPPKQKKTKVFAGIDLGIKRLITIYDSNKKSKIIGRKRWFKQWEYWTELISKEKSKLSLHNKRTSNNLKRLYDKRTKYMTNLHNNVVANLGRYLLRNKIDNVFIGDVTNIRKKVSKSKKKNQMTHNYWSFDKILHKIQNKTEEQGTTIKQITEEYTSMTCPVCGYSNEDNNNDRSFVCLKCNYSDDRDIVGARNILLKGMHSPKQNMHLGEIAQFEVSV